MSFTNGSQKLNEQLEERFQVLDVHLRSDVDLNAAHLRLKRRVRARDLQKKIAVHHTM